LEGGVILRHYSAAPLVFDPTRTYASNSFKPHGLWLSVADEHGWKEWCEGEDFNIEGLAHSVDFAPTDSANILHLNSVGAIQDFTHEYKLQAGGRYNLIINWARVTSGYDGIIISPYQWSCRHDLMWYYPWDCASGCVWNLNALRLENNNGSRTPQTAQTTPR
jgi:hypothetical protein